MRSARVLLALLLVAMPLAGAKRPVAEQEKIDWLLSEIERSDAVFLRNGAEYDGHKAASHLKTKLFWGGKQVQTARDFIVGVCSRSEASGKPYEIRLKSGPTRPLEKWLLERLEAFEKR
ncbi:MAG TPA: DUF5329 family protein [Thermoanaerobaculia bacterium]|nr:DUF5329 family protein [Thermoanaerobaculia bacterium]